MNVQTVAGAEAAAASFTTCLFLPFSASLSQLHSPAYASDYADSRRQERRQCPRRLQVPRPPSD